MLVLSIIENILLLKALRDNSQHSQEYSHYQKHFVFKPYLLRFLVLVFYQNLPYILIDCFDLSQLHLYEFYQYKYYHQKILLFQIVEININLCLFYLFYILSLFI